MCRCTLLRKLSLCARNHRLLFVHRLSQFIDRGLPIFDFDVKLFDVSLQSTDVYPLRFEL